MDPRPGTPNSVKSDDTARCSTPKLRSGDASRCSSPAVSTSGAYPVSVRQQMARFKQMEMEQMSPSGSVDGDASGPGSTPSSAQRRRVPKVQRRNGRGETPLHLAARKGDIDMVEKLIAEGAQVDQGDNAGWTPLHEACSGDRYETVECLLRNGANVNARSTYGNLPIEDAARANSPKLLWLLLRHGSLRERALEFAPSGSVSRRLLAAKGIPETWPPPEDSPLLRKTSRQTGVDSSAEITTASASSSSSSLAPPSSDAPPTSAAPPTYKAPPTVEAPPPTALTIPISIVVDTGEISRPRNMDEGEVIGEPHTPLLRIAESGEDEEEEEKREKREQEESSRQAEDGEDKESASAALAIEENDDPMATEKSTDAVTSTTGGFDYLEELQKAAAEEEEGDEEGGEEKEEGGEEEGQARSGVSKTKRTAVAMGAGGERKKQKTKRRSGRGGALARSAEPEMRPSSSTAGHLFASSSYAPSAAASTAGDDPYEFRSSPEESDNERRIRTELPSEERELSVPPSSKRARQTASPSIPGDAEMDEGDEEDDSSRQGPATAGHRKVPPLRISKERIQPKEEEGVADDDIVSAVAGGTEHAGREGYSEGAGRGKAVVTRIAARPAARGRGGALLEATPPAEDHHGRVTRSRRQLGRGGGGGADEEYGGSGRKNRRRTAAALAAAAGSHAGSVTPRGENSGDGVEQAEGERAAAGEREVSMQSDIQSTASGSEGRTLLTIAESTAPGLPGLPEAAAVPAQFADDVTNMTMMNSVQQRIELDRIIAARLAAAVVAHQERMRSLWCPSNASELLVFNKKHTEPQPEFVPAPMPRDVSPVMTELWYEHEEERFILAWQQQEARWRLRIYMEEICLLRERRRRGQRPALSVVSFLRDSECCNPHAFVGDRHERPRQSDEEWAAAMQRKAEELFNEHRLKANTTHAVQFWAWKDSARRRKVNPGRQLLDDFPRVMPILVDIPVLMDGDEKMPPPPPSTDDNLGIIA